MDVRSGTAEISIIDIVGEITANSETVLMEAFTKAGEGVRTVALNFSELEYMNSGGIGLLVTLLVRANRAKQNLVAFGLTDHYKEIFELTRLDEAITIHPSEQHALATVAS